MKRRTAHQRGGVLIVALMVITVMLIMAIPFMAKMSTQARSSERTYRALSAFNLAEAGADLVLWEMNQPFAVTDPIITIDEDGNRVFGPEDEAVGNWTGQFEGTVVDNLAVEPNLRTLVSTGHMPFIADGTVDRTVEIVLEKYFKSVFEFGFFVDDYFLHGTNFLLDSYDSRDGTYGGDNIGDLGWFGTNGSDTGTWLIDRGTSSEIDGGVAAGWETNPDDLGDVIDIPDGTKGDYDTMILSSEFELPSVNIFDLPAKDMFDHQGDETLEAWFSQGFKDNYLTADANGVYNYQQPDFMPSLALNDIGTDYLQGNLGEVLFPKNTTTTLTSEDSGVYTSFVMERNSTVTIEGHVVIYVTGVEGLAATGEFANHGGDILIAEGGSLTMILGNTSFMLENTTYINIDGAGPDKDGNPADCIILGTDQFYYDGQGDVGLFNWENDVNVAAAIYAPRSHLLATQGGTNIELYGAAILNSWDTKSNVDIHFDEALGDLMIVEGGTPYWRIINWAERVGGE